MKKAFLFLSLLAATATQAQITVTKTDGTPVTNGQVFVFNSLDYEAAYFGFLVHNTTNAPIETRISCESVTGGTGAGMELCYGNVCLASVTPGHLYPSSSVTIAPGGTNSQFDHFLATQAGTAPVTDYVFKFYAEDEFGGPTGNTVTITYRYDPNALNSETFAASNTAATLLSSVVGSTLDVKASQNVLLEVYNVNGKRMTREHLEAGTQSIDVSNLASGVYIASFQTQDNRKNSVKFVKK